MKSQESRQISLMLATGFFMGIFVATYQVTADSLFLNRMGGELNKAFLAAGFLGIVATALFSAFQSFIRFTALALGSLFLILLFVISIYYALHTGNSENHNILIFALYSMSGPITAIILLSFWGIFGRLFNFRQSKRIIGWIDTGQLIAAILTTLLVIPLTSAIIPDTSSYLLVCAGSIFMVSILLIYISSTFKLSRNEPTNFEGDVETRKETSLIRIFKQPYTLLMSGFLLISMVTLVLGQYTFQELVQEQYPKERDLTNFNSFFNAAVFGISLIMQTFVNQRIITNYGLRVSLLILPLVVAVLSVLGIGTGFIFGYDKVEAPDGFIYFFLFIALGRLFNWTLRESLEAPVFKLFFIPLDNKIRFTIQSKLEGMVNESSRFIAGLIIFGISFLPFIKIIHIPFLFIVLAGLYYLVTNRLYSGYRNKIRQKLENTDYQLDKLERGFTLVVPKLEAQLTQPFSGKAIFSYKLLEKINAAQVPFWLNNLIRNPDENTRYYAQEKINELNGLSVSDQYVIRMDGDKAFDAGKTLLSRSDLHQILENGGDITKARIMKLTRSANSNDRHYAAELMMQTSVVDCNSYLMELLHDSESKVRSTAIKTSVKRNSPEIVNAVIENLGNSIFSNQAMNALQLMGPDTLTPLDTAFYKSGQSSQVMLRIVQVIGRIGGTRAKEILWNKIDYPNKVIVSQVLLSLGECGFKAGFSQITRIKYAIESDIADIRWNLSAIQEVGSDGFVSDVKASLKWEIANDVEHIYMLLTMLYDTRSIQLVKENIDSATPEGITYAIELLDVFLSEQLKQRVIPILDDLTDVERINRLDVYYPRVKLDEMMTLKFLINRDFTQSNRWTKACCLFQIGLKRYSEFKLDLIAQLFNPDQLVREVSAWALNQISPEEYKKHVQRLGPVGQRQLDLVVVNRRRMSQFEMVLFLSKISVFDGVPGITLSYLAEFGEEFRLVPGETLILDESNNNYFYIVTAGEVVLVQKGEPVRMYWSGQFIGEKVGHPHQLGNNMLVVKQETSLLRYNKDQFYELLADNIMVADRVLEFID